MLPDVLFCLSPSSADPSSHLRFADLGLCSRGMRVLIVGCGYLGTAAGALLVQSGHEVVGLRRTNEGHDELLAHGIEPVLGDITDPQSLGQLTGTFDAVVNTVSSSRGGADVYRAVYLEGTRTLLEWLRPHPVRRYVYTSSTSVYGQADGSTVDEESPAEPGTETGTVLRATEELLLDAARSGFPAVILRVAGIYGPGRGHLFRQFLDGEARLSGDGHRCMNMIHRDDAATAIVAALERGQGGRIYNCTDDESVTQRHFLEWLSDQLSRPMPGTADEEAPTRKKRGITHKRVSNLRLRSELGWVPRHPTFREGYAEDIARARQSLAPSNGTVESSVH